MGIPIHKVNMMLYSIRLNNKQPSSLLKLIIGMFTEVTG